MATMVLAGPEMERMQGRSAARRAASAAERNRELLEEQRARRRGPTPEMFFAKHIDNSRMVKSEDMDRRREMKRFTLVMTLLFGLTFLYVWQHFSAIEVGYSVEAQKQQVEQLREENRQLRLSEAELSDPRRIDVIAKQLGLDRPLPGQVVREDAAPVDGPTLAQAQVQGIGNRE